MGDQPMKGFTSSDKENSHLKLLTEVQSCFAHRLGALNSKKSNPTAHLANITAYSWHSFALTCKNGKLIN